MKPAVIFIVTIFPTLLFCQQELKKGNVITEFGETYEVINPDFKTDVKKELKVVFDVGRSFGDSTKVNPLIHTAARFLNMHVNAGVPVNNLNVALIIHGNAADDILNNKNYKIKYGIDNPNEPLISSLAEKGVQVILCGQTAAYRNISKPKIHPDIKIALSAMTALVQLQNEEYRLINF